MTDGIIQKVFRDYFSNDIKTVSQLQQKLIEKIKQNAVWQSNLELHMLSQEALIGDNQE